VVVVDPQTFGQLFDSINLIGRLTGTSARAAGLNRSLETRIAAVRRKISNRAAKSPRVFVEISLQPLMTVGPGSFIAEMLTLLGAVNTGAGLPRAYCRVSPEFILEQDPEWLVLSSPGARDYFLNNPVFAKVTAVAKKQVIDNIDPDLLMRPGPRLINGLEQLAEKIYGIKTNEN
jgi:iron complex transport system substrate-binding protein